MLQVAIRRAAELGGRFRFSLLFALLAVIVLTVGCNDGWGGGA